MPLGRVPFKRMVLVPLTSETMMRDLLRPAYDPFPITELRKVVLLSSSQPHSAYLALMLVLRDPNSAGLFGNSSIYQVGRNWPAFANQDNRE